MPAISIVNSLCNQEEIHPWIKNLPFLNCYMSIKICYTYGHAVTRKRFNAEQASFFLGRVNDAVCWPQNNKEAVSIELSYGQCLALTTSLLSRPCCSYYCFVFYFCVDWTQHFFAFERKTQRLVFNKCLDNQSNPQPSDCESYPIGNH